MGEEAIGKNIAQEPCVECLVKSASYEGLKRFHFPY